MKKRFKNNYLRYILGLLAGCSAAHALAQTFPTRPIRFVLGPAPELLPRLVSQKLSELWGQQVVVDPRPGAGGIVAGDIVSRATPDGYTWLVSTGSFYLLDAVSNKHSYNMVRDFAPVALMATIPFICVVHPSVPAKSMAELVQLARAQPGKMNFASAGNGTTTQLAAELFKLTTKTDIVHVPYKGVVPAMTDLLGGQVQMMFVVAQAAVPHLQSGKVRALGITAKKRSSAAPEVPTLTELGFPEIDIVAWNGVSVPKAVPSALVNRINADVRKVLAPKDMQDRLISAGLDPADTTVEQFQAFVQGDVKRYDRIVHAAKLKLD